MPPSSSVPDHQAAPGASASPRRGGVTPQSPLRIKQDGKFYERLLTKETSAAAGNLSFRYYWAEPGSVPFVWETQPGTPKDVAAGMAAGALPAITPPPSYRLRHCNSKVAASHAHHQQQQQSKRAPKSRKRCRLRIRIRIGFIAGIFRRLSLRKAWRSSAPPPVKASSSSRWLFCSAATERSEHDHHDNDDVSAAPQEKPVFFRARPRPWLLRFRGGGNGGWAAA